MIACLAVAFILIDLSLRARRMKKTRLRAFETVALPIVIVGTMIKTANIAFLSLVGASMLSTAMVLKEFYANVFATVYMYFIPQFEPDDVVNVIGYEEKYGPFIFRQVNWLRSPLHSTSGEIFLVPNRILLNDSLKLN